jgi:aquaporin Z
MPQRAKSDTLDGSSLEVQHMNKLVTEFVGTFFLVLTIALAVASGSVLAPLVIGLVLAVMVYMGGPVSGGHYNPAVTLAVCLRGKIKPNEAVGYVVVQLLGAFCAAAVGYSLTLTQDAAGKDIPHVLYVLPGKDYSTIQALVAEMVFTFALALVVLNTATVKRTAGNSYFGLAIGMTVAVGAACAGHISGGAFNPAVGVGSLAFAAIKGASVSHGWLYIAGPLLGAAVAALVFKIQHGPNAE